MRIAIAGDYFRDPGSAATLAPDLFEDCDFAFANLEGPVTERRRPAIKTGPSLRMAQDAVKYLVGAGANGVTLANNHILDFGLGGLRDTLECCARDDVLTVGAGTTEPDMNQPLVLTQGQLSVAILNYAEQEWNTLGGLGANISTTARVGRTLRRVSAEHDACILILHGGNEYHPLPSPQTVDRLRFFAECGASAVVMHHAHCFSGMEMWEGVPIYYGLGNFQFTRPSAKKEWYTGLIVKLDIHPSAPVSSAHCFVSMNSQNYDVKLMSGAECEEAAMTFEQRSAIISSESDLLAAWRVFAADRRLQYLQLMTPWPGKGRNSFRMRAVLGLGVTGRLRTAQALWLNVLRCDAHRAALQQVLEDSLGASDTEPK